MLTKKGEYWPARSQELAMGGCFGGLEAEPHRSKILHFLQKYSNLILGLF